jgi:hypothetical protein
MTKKNQEMLILAKIFEVFEVISQIPGAMVVSKTNFCTMASNTFSSQYENQFMSQFW